MVSPRVAPFLIAAAVTGLVLVAVTMTPYFAGDVWVERTVQSAFGDTGWASTVTSTATAPLKYVVMAVTLALAYRLAGWKGAAIAAVVIIVEQYIGEPSKLIAQRPRPSRELVRVIGNPSGFSFPSTFTTFYAVTFGTLWLLAGRVKTSQLTSAVTVLAPIAIVVGWTARVVLGAHWPSDVVLTTVVCLAWVWAITRVVLPRASR